MALSFPVAPVNGTQHTSGNVLFTYNSTTNSWVGESPVDLLPLGSLVGDVLSWNGSGWIPQTDKIHDANMAVANDF